MDKDMDKDRFLKVYNNLPINLREEVILVLPEHGNITWKVACWEINGGTPLGEQIFNRLLELGII